MVTLFGEVLRSTPTHVVFSVARKLGDAEALGIAGQITLPVNQVCGLVKQARGKAKGYWMIRISYELADLVAKHRQVSK